MTASTTLIHCPQCGTPPNPAEVWPCADTSCDQKWEVFDTMGTCCSCGSTLSEVACPRCQRTSPLSDWYEAGWEAGVQLRHFPTSQVLYLNFEPNAYADWENQVLTWLEEAVPFPLKIVVTLSHREDAFTWKCYSDEANQANLQQRIPKIRDLMKRAPTPKMIAHTIMMDANLRKAGPLSGYISVRQAEEDAFENLSLKEQFEALKSWAYEDALPMLGAFAAQMDRKFKGIRGMGRRLPAVDPKFPHEASRKTSGDPYYWRAFVEELEADDPILIMMKVLLHAGHGQLERARLFASLYRVFANQRTFAHFYYEEFLWRLQSFLDNLKMEFERIEECLEEGEWDIATEACEHIKDFYPNCAKVFHYLFMIKQGEGILSETRLEIRRDKVVSKIFEINPWFSAWEYQKTKYDAYHHQLRKEGKALIALVGAAPDTDGTITFLIRLGIIATEIKDWGFAAHIFALLTKYRGLIEVSGSLHVMSWLMFALKKLRIRDLTSRYKGDLLHEQRQIERLLESLKKADPAYQ